MEREMFLVLAVVLVVLPGAMMAKYQNPCNKKAAWGKRPCLIGGVCYKTGEITKAACDRCRCKNGELSCYLMGCPKKREYCPGPTFWRYSNRELCTKWTCQKLRDYCEIVDCNSEGVQFQDCLD